MIWIRIKCIDIYNFNNKGSIIFIQKGNKILVFDSHLTIYSSILFS